MNSSQISKKRYKKNPIYKNIDDLLKDINIFPSVNCVSGLDAEEREIEEDKRVRPEIYKLEKVFDEAATRNRLKIDTIRTKGGLIVTGECQTGPYSLFIDNKLNMYGIANHLDNLDKMPSNYIPPVKKGETLFVTLSPYTNLHTFVPSSNASENSIISNGYDIVDEIISDEGYRLIEENEPNALENKAFLYRNYVQPYIKETVTHDQYNERIKDRDALEPRIKKENAVLDLMNIDQIKSLQLDSKSAIELYKTVHKMQKQKKLDSDIIPLMVTEIKLKYCSKGERGYNSYQKKAITLINAITHKSKPAEQIYRGFDTEQKAIGFY